MDQALAINHGKIKRPFNIFFYSQPGLGKSTFAGQSDSPIFIGAENNEELDIHRFPVPKTFDEVIKQLDHLLASEHKYKTVVIDTLDSIETLVHKKVLASDPKQSGSISQAHGGYGRGYEMAANEMIKLRDRLQRLWSEKHMNVVVLSHCKKKTAVDTTLGASYDTYESCLHDKIQSLFMDWSSAVLYGTYQARLKEDKNSEKMFMLGDGQRVLFSESRPGFKAKNRYNLPFEMELSFAEFYQNYEAFYRDQKRPWDQIIVTVQALMDLITDAELKAKIIMKIEEAGKSVDKLEVIEKRLKEITKQ